MPHLKPHLKTVALTRPLLDAAKMATDLQAQGVRVILAPMLTINPLQGAIAQLTQHLQQRPQAIAVTSKHAVKALLRQPEGRDIPLYAVGNSTAQFARSNGFMQVHEASGNAQALEKLLIASCDKAGGKILYPHARDIAYDLAGALRKHGFGVAELIVYEAELATALPQEFLDALQQDEVDEIWFSSQRAAAGYAKLAATQQFLQQHENVTCVAISQKVARAAKLPWKHIFIRPSYHYSVRKGGFAIFRNDTPIHTPAGHVLAAPNETLAQALVEEWSMQGEKVDKSALPLTSVIVIAIDMAQHQHEALLTDVLPYIETDLLSYRIGDNPDLLQTQIEAHDPWLQWAATNMGIELNVTQELMPVAQSEQCLRTLRERLTAYDPWRLAIFALCVKPLSSAVLALALTEGKLNGAEAFRLSHLEEAFETSKWGVDDEKEVSLNSRKTDLLTAERFLRLLNQG